MSFSKLWHQDRWQLVLGAAGILIWDDPASMEPVALASTWPRNSPRDWQSLLTLADLLLEQQKHLRPGTQLEVLMAWHWHRALSRPWRTNHMAEDAQAMFAHAFGAQDGGWRLTSTAAGYRRPSMIFGMEQSFYSALVALALKYNLSLSFVGPAMLAALARTPTASVMIVVEPANVILLQIESRHLLSLVAERSDTTPERAIEQLWRRATLRQPTLAPSVETSHVPVLDLRATNPTIDILRVSSPFALKAFETNSVRCVPG